MQFKEFHFVFSPLLTGQNGVGLENEGSGRAQKHLYACSRAGGRVMGGEPRARIRKHIENGYSPISYIVILRTSFNNKKKSRDIFIC